MKTIIILFLALSAVSARDTVVVKTTSFEEPYSKPTGLIISSIGAGATTILAFSFGLASLKTFHGAGADIGGGVLLLASIPWACATAVLSGISVYKYREWKNWSSEHGVSFDLQIDPVSGKSGVAFGYTIPIR